MSSIMSGSKIISNIMSGGPNDSMEAADNVASIKGVVEKLSNQIEALEELKGMLADGSKKRDMLMGRFAVSAQIRVTFENGGIADFSIDHEDHNAMERLVPLAVTILTERVRDCIAKIDIIASDMHTPPL